MENRKRNLWVLLFACVIGAASALFIFFLVRSIRGPIASDSILSTPTLKVDKIEGVNLRKVVSVPKFKSKPSGPRLVTNANDPGYDPSKLSKFGISLSEIFPNEPRDPVWALPMEERIVKGMAADLAEVFPDMKVNSVECRTMMCAIVIESQQRKDLTLLSPMMSWAIYGNVQEVNISRNPSENTATWYCLFEREWRDLEKFKGFSEQARADSIAARRLIPDYKWKLPAK